MPIRRTSNRSSQDSGFYTPEVFSDVGSRIVSGPPGVQQYFDFESFVYEDVSGIWVDWVPSGG